MTILRAAGGQLPALLLFGTVCGVTTKRAAWGQLLAMLLLGTVCGLTTIRVAWGTAAGSTSVYFRSQ